MTDLATSRHTDSFWNRVRLALDGLRPVGGVPAYGRAEIDRTEGISGDALVMEEELQLCWEWAAAQGKPLSLLLVQIDRFADYLTAYGSADAAGCLQTLGQIIGDGLGKGSVCMPHERNGFAVLLPGMGKAEGRALALKISAALRRQAMPHKESHAGVVTASIGLATTLPSGAYDAGFAGFAAKTLRQAQRRGMGRMMAIDLKPEQGQRRAA